MNISKLKGKFVEKDMSTAEAACALGISRDSLYRKLNNAEKFTIGDVRKLKSVLSLTDKEAIDIFLS